MEKVTLICPKCGMVVTGKGKTLVEAQCQATFNLRDHEESSCKPGVSRPEKAITLG